jgi:2-hydroxy-3-keto-5-methylthiopentenyl-1-phosphate phosphatase
MRIFCDFDGTVSQVDTTDHILSLFAGPAWETLEDDWLAGRITAAACMQAQIGLIAASEAELDRALDSIELTPGFQDFAAWCADQGVALTIVSDGVDRFIHRILARHGLAGLPVISNRLVGDQSARGLDQPWLRAGCAAGSGVCKCAVVDAAAPGEAGPLVFIGDGRSDFCVSARADILFAKDSLAAYAADRGMAFHRLDDFHNVTQALDLVRKTRVAAAG